MATRSYAASLRGFTLVELVITMIVMGILAVVALPRFANQSTFESRGFTDQTLAALQFARKVAVASGRNVCVESVADPDPRLKTTMAPVRGSSIVCDAAEVNLNPVVKWRTYSGVAYGSSLNVIFYADGSSSSDIATVTGDSTYNIVVESTGYVHCNPISACE
jgi:MSHA pilin protein MshC